MILRVHCTRVYASPSCAPLLLRVQQRWVYGRGLEITIFAPRVVHFTMISNVKRCKIGAESKSTKRCTKECERIINYRLIEVYASRRLPRYIRGMHERRRNSKWRINLSISQANSFSSLQHFPTNFNFWKITARK